VIAPELIKKINLVFHEEEARTYDERHPEILRAERTRWREIARIVDRHLTSLGRPAVLVDLGTGTGFVPSAVLPVLREADRLICTDISPNMIERARRLISAVAPKAHVDFCIADLEQFDPGVGVDIFTINSTLHHIFSPSAVLERIAARLNRGGLLIIAHEPNKRFISNMVLRRLFTSGSAVRRLLRGVRTILTQTSVDHLRLQRMVYERLLREQVIKADDGWISPENLQRFVDVHSPTATGRLDVEEGFDPADLHPMFEQWQCICFDTWNFAPALGDWRGRPLVEGLLKKLYPRDGLLFSIVLQKSQKAV
jgi:ubiquinone/menaquinone biosynthesis C-methylase UbiE